MKKTLTILLAIVFFAACGSKGKKLDNKSSVHKYIAVVENVGGYNVAYTKDGHTIIYYNDSIGNFVAYYAKFDDSAGKYGYDRVKEKIVRTEIDFSLKTLKSIMSVYGGAFCFRNDITGYSAFYFDEQMNGNRIDQITAHLDDAQSNEAGKDQEIKRLISLLNVAYSLAHSINNNVSGWNNMVLALESVKELTNYDIIKNDTVYDPKIKAHISKIINSTKGLTQFYDLLLEKYINQKSNTNQ